MTSVISDVSLRELIINPLVLNTLFLYPLKTSENRRVFLKTSENLILLGGQKKGAMGTNELKHANLSQR